MILLLSGSTWPAKAAAGMRSTTKAWIRSPASGLLQFYGHPRSPRATQFRTQGCDSRSTRSGRPGVGMGPGALPVPQLAVLAVMTLIRSWIAAVFSRLRCHETGSRRPHHCHRAPAIAMRAYERWYFPRDPDRDLDPQARVVSPADGRIVYVARVEGGTVPIAVKNRRKSRSMRSSKVKTDLPPAPSSGSSCHRSTCITSAAPSPVS